MARPPKDGLDYFPLDVDIASDEKVEYIEAKFGLEGFATIIHLLAAIYRSGYYIKWGEMQVYVTSKRINLPVNTLQEIVSHLVNVDFFDRNLYETFSILTSHGIQTRYLQACEYRKKIHMVKEFCLLTAEDGVKEGRFLYQPAPKIVKQVGNPSQADIKQVGNPSQDDIKQAESTQSKVKKSNVVVTRAHARDIEEGNTSEVFTAFSNNIHPLTGEIEADTLGDLLDHYGKEWVLEAIKEAAKNHGTSVKYIEAILQAWERNGFKAPKKGRGNRNGRYTQGNSGADREEPEGLRKLKEDMAYADAHTVHPWDVQPDGGGDGAEPGKDSGVRGRASTM